MQQAQKRYNHRNTDESLRTFEQAKEVFEEARKEDCQNFILEKTKHMNAAQATQFWKEFNSLFKPKADQNISCLLVNDTIITDETEIEEEMFSTFFEAKHIQDNWDDFDQQFYNNVIDIYSDIESIGSEIFKDKGIFSKQN